MRGDKGVCYGEGRGLGGDVLLLFVEEVFLELRVVTLGLGRCARMSHAPVPSREGRFGCYFSV